MTGENMETIREQIIKECIQRAAVIKSTNSPQEYATDIGKNVLRARPTYAPSDPPCIIIFPLPEESHNTYGQTMHIMTMHVEAAQYYGDTDPSIISEQMLGDIIKCFASPSWDRRRPVISASPPESPEPEPLPPLADTIEYTGGGIEEYPEDGALVVGAKANFAVTYYTKIGDPYEQQQ
jgi:hypothetical protein